MDIKPIETFYNGYRFRSRLEARWAVFFDSLGMPYEYEPEGFSLSDGTFYLPDFYLPQSREWFEVKGVMSSEDQHKVDQFVSDTCFPVAIGYSDFTFQSPIMDGSVCIGIDEKGSSYFGKCYSCQNFYFIGESASYRCTSCGYYDGNCTMDICAFGNDCGFDSWSPVIDAVLAAKQARFEHGEKPKVKKIEKQTPGLRGPCEQVKEIDAYWRKLGMPTLEEYKERLRHNGDLHTLALLIKNTVKPYGGDG